MLRWKAGTTRMGHAKITICVNGAFRLFVGVGDHQGLEGTTKEVITVLQP